MKYVYAYKTSDGVRHEASMDAASREAVFEDLRRRGIRAIKVVACDGSKANGETRGVRARTVVAGLAAIAALAVVAAVFFGRAGGGPTAGRQSAARPLARQEIGGDRTLLQNLPDGFFACGVEAFLARFAEPGRPFSAPEGEWPSKGECEAALAEPVKVSDGEHTERRDLKRIVAGLKAEMKSYLDAGGFVSGYVRELIRRQQTEIAQRDKANRQLMTLTSRIRTGADERRAYEYWLQANARLQSMGIYALPLPERLRDCQRTFEMSE